MLIDHFNDCAQRLHCTDVERDACLETAAALLHFWTDVRQNGPLFIGGSRAEQDPNPFFRACLLDAIDLIWTDEEPLLENLYVQYLAAGDYHGADFLQNVVIAKGILTFLKFLHEHEDGGSYRQWGDRLSVAVGGYFGVEYREKFRKTLLREIRKRERDVAKVSFLPEFDALMELPLPLCGKLLQDIPGDITLALKYASGAVQDHVLSVLSQEEREAFDDRMDLYANVRQCDVERAQREVLKQVAGYQS